MDDIKVKDRDGTLEYWSYDRLLNSIGRAGVPISDAEKIADNVEKWVKKNTKKDTISSVEIRDRVFEEMMKDFPVQADNYQAYKK